jgi:hypothetical protein
MKRIALFPLIVSGYAIYYVADVFGGKFETVGYGFLCVALVLLLASLNLAQDVTSSEPSLVHQPATWRGLYPFAFLALYALGQVTFGFAIATFIVSAGFLWWQGYRRIGKLLALSGATTLVAYVILIEILNVPMPEGLLGPRTFL